MGVGKLNFAAIKAASPQFAEAFCRRYLGAGKRVGQWWLVSCPWREDKNPSLGVCLETGGWKDFGKGDHGDLTDLLARLERIPLPEAFDRLSRMMGVRA